ncbi:MAG TPA: LuxR C-terminal-related transcriptional regulator, partial [Anaerolineales bacterium]|nr:LuxR C-terminal-related transcriptional regulator [Anaerolineales bacterium]
YWKMDAAERGRIRSQVEALILEALAYYADSNLPQASQTLNESLALGHAKGFRRLFLDEGRRLAVLLQAALPTLPNRTLSLFATALLQSFPLDRAEQGLEHAAEAVEGIQTEALSQQEVRVLRLLVAGLSNAEIARELVVSTNTIKTHVKSIYRKLNINSRSEARQVARELRLL